jgi:hypothetical protein
MLWLQEQNKAEELYNSLRDKKFTNPEQAFQALFSNRMTLDEIERDIRHWAQTKVYQSAPSGPAVGKSSERFR